MTFVHRGWIAAGATLIAASSVLAQQAGMPALRTWTAQPPPPAQFD